MGPRGPGIHAQASGNDRCVALQHSIWRGRVLEGEVTPRQISERGIHDPEIAALEAKVEVVTDQRVDDLFNATKEKEFFYYPSSITVTVRGKNYYRFEESPRGYDLRRALTAEEVLAKFISNASGVIGATAAKQAADMLLDLENLGSVKKLEILRSR